MLNLMTATPTQLKQQTDPYLAKLSPAQRQWAEGVARKLAASTAPFNLSNIRSEAGNVPGPLPTGQPAELVVIAIIAILICLLVPAVQKVPSAPQQTAPQTRYRQLVEMLSSVLQKMNDTQKTIAHNIGG